MNGHDIPKVKRILVLAVAIAAAFAGLNWYERVRAEAPEVSGPPIEYDHLANQETDPFLFSGKVMDENHPRWRQYRRAIRKFRDVRDCLVDGEQGKRKPNLQLFDWKQTGMVKGAEVCVFRITRSLGNVERVQQWLLSQGFRLSPFARYRSEDYKVRYDTQPVSDMSAYWTIEQYRKYNPSLIGKLTGFDLALQYEIVLQFSENNQVVGVAVVIPSK